MQARRGATEVEFLGHGDEITEVAEFDAFVHMYGISISISKVLDI